MPSTQCSMYAHVCAHTRIQTHLVLRHLRYLQQLDVPVILDESSTLNIRASLVSNLHDEFTAFRLKEMAKNACTINKQQNKLIILVSSLQV